MNNWPCPIVFGNIVFFNFSNVFQFFNFSIFVGLFFFVCITYSIVEQPMNLSRITNMYTDEVIDFLNNQSVNNSIYGTSKPWFIYYGFEQPHIPLFRSPGFKNISRRGTFGDTVQEIDYNVGLIMDTLKKTGFDNNTLVIFTSDNGGWIDPNSGSTFANSVTVKQYIIVHKCTFGIFVYCVFGATCQHWLHIGLFVHAYTVHTTNKIYCHTYISN